MISMLRLLAVPWHFMVAPAWAVLTRVTGPLVVCLISSKTFLLIATPDMSVLPESI